LAFPVAVTPEASKLAHILGVKIFISDKMHHLFDQFKRYKNNIDRFKNHMNNNKDENKKDSADEACVLKIMQNFVFNDKDPIVLEVDILQGILKVSLWLQ
jgi:translation initiation factor 5B